MATPNYESIFQLFRVAELPASYRQVVLTMLALANADGEVHATAKTIATDCALRPQTVGKILKDLSFTWAVSRQYSDGGGTSWDCKKLIATTYDHAVLKAASDFVKSSISPLALQTLESQQGKRGWYMFVLLAVYNGNTKRIQAEVKPSGPDAFSIFREIVPAYKEAA